MSNSELPLHEETIEWNDSEDECLSSRDLESEDQLLEEYNFEGFSSLFGLINSPTNPYTLGTPEDTSSPVVSPKKQSFVGQRKKLFEGFTKSDSEDVDSKVGLMVGTRAKVKKEKGKKVKMDLTLHKKQVEFLNKEVEDAAKAFKTLAETLPAPPKEELGKLIAKNIAKIDRIKRKNNMFFELSTKAETESQLKGVMELEKSLEDLEARLSNINVNAKELIDRGGDI